MLAAVALVDLCQRHLRQPAHSRYAPPIVLFFHCTLFHLVQGIRSMREHVRGSPTLSPNQIPIDESEAGRLRALTLDTLVAHLREQADFQPAQLMPLHTFDTKVEALAPLRRVCHDRRTKTRASWKS
jgi:hypothetical protein